MLHFIVDIDYETLLYHFFSYKSVEDRGIAGSAIGMATAFEICEHYFSKYQRPQNMADYMNFHRSIWAGLIGINATRYIVFHGEPYKSHDDAEAIAFGYMIYKKKPRFGFKRNLALMLGVGIGYDYHESLVGCLPHYGSVTRSLHHLPEYEIREIRDCLFAK